MRHVFLVCSVLTCTWPLAAHAQEVDLTVGARARGQQPDKPSRPEFNATAFVHVDGDPHVVLERLEGDGLWVPACTVPCDQDLPLTSVYRLAGPGIRASAPFVLAAPANARVVMHVRAASTAGFVNGILLTSAGGASIVGAIWAAAERVGSELKEPGLGLGTRSSEGSWDGIDIALGAGIAGVLVGVLVLASNVHSTAEVGPLPKSDDAWLRTPTWREDPSAAALSKRTASMPLVQLRF